MSCSSAEVHRHFWGMYCLHFQGSKSKQETSSKLTELLMCDFRNYLDVKHIRYKKRHCRVSKQSWPILRYHIHDCPLKLQNGDNKNRKVYLLQMKRGKGCEYEEFYLLGCNTMQSIESQLMFWRNMSSPSSGLKNKPSKKPARSR
jgi:hypothetical protein